MQNIKFVLSYDGTGYHGFQDQGDDQPTIQSSLEQAVHRLTGESLRVTGAGRTDAGVHAQGQVFNLRTNSRIPIDRWPYALNSVLPRDIVVLSASEVAQDFHARFCAIGKTYRYSIDNDIFANVFSRRYAYHVREPLDTTAMSAAGSLLVGKHDFAAFRSTGSSAATTVRTITSLDVERHGHMVTVEVSAEGFLYNMVRIISGALIDVGRGYRRLHAIADALRTGDRTLLGATAPPHGLCLVQVGYPSD